MKESTIENYLVAEVKKLGGEVRKVKWIGRRGAPDRMVILPGKALWIELKAPGVVSKPHQIREHARMERSGMIVFIIDSLEKVDEVLRGN